MSQLLNPDQTLRTETSRISCTVKQFLGGGGQGEVYAAELGGKPVALKWYRPDYLPYDPALQTRLRTAISRGSPSDAFLWPMELVVGTTIPGFGYIMPLRGVEYRGMVDLMSCRINPTFQALATAGLQLSDSFLQLHTKGLCYRDINWGNIFVNPDIGDVLICDNDNVSVEGEDETAVWGTPGFMAPEIMCREAPASRETDLYSLSVLLFQMFIVHHPLHGRREGEIKCLDIQSRYYLYAESPIFIFDPNDDSNRPIDGDRHYANALTFWPIYPQFLRDRFIQSFTKGLHDPGARVAEGVWRSTMVRLRDTIFRCPDCRCENFFDLNRPQGSSSPACWNCQLPLPTPGRIRIGKILVMLNQDTQLFPHHIDDQRLYDFSKPVAMVNRHPQQAIWGLQNLSSTSWQVALADGTIGECPPGRTVQLKEATRINFGKAEGEILV